MNITIISVGKLKEKYGVKIKNLPELTAEKMDFASCSNVEFTPFNLCILTTKGKNTRRGRKEFC